MVSYARPYQHMTYYEIDDVIRGFSIPDKTDDPGVEPIDQQMKGPYRAGTRFTYLQNAVWRGVNLEVIMGDARLSLEPLQEKYNTSGIPGAKDNSYLYHADFKKFTEKDPKDARYYMGAPFDHTYSKSPARDHFYKGIVVDAFSSDAIPVHLMTTEAMELYFRKLAPGGILAVHISNRYLDLAPVVAATADSAGLVSVAEIHVPTAAQRRISDEISPSNWVLVARGRTDLGRLAEDSRWHELDPAAGPVWTDDYSNILSVLRH
jgi:hypothetical protein